MNEAQSQRDEVDRKIANAIGGRLPLEGSGPTRKCQCGREVHLDRTLFIRPIGEGDGRFEVACFACCDRVLRRAGYVRVVGGLVSGGGERWR